MQSAYQATLGDQAAFGLYLLLFYKESTFGCGFFSGFTNAEYHIVCVDFICSSRGRLKRDRGFANPLSLSNTSPDPWGDPLRRGILAAAVYTNSGSCIPVLSFIPSSESGFAVCVRAGIVRVSVGVLGLGRTFFIIGGDGLFVPAATWCFAFSFVGFALTAIVAFVLADNGTGQLHR